MPQRDRLHQLLIPAAALIAVLPLIIHGPSCGHDFDFHLLSWLEAARQFSHGNLHPAWAFTPAFNAGEPRFVFYPPLSWTLGAILGLIFPWTWAPILYTWITLTAAGFTLHRLARCFATPTAATFAAVFYLVNPYMLFTAYERTAYAELLGAVWIPLLIQAILRPDEQGGVTIPRIALPVALLWLTNAPAAVMSCYALALLTVVKLATTPGAPFMQSHRMNGHRAPARPLSSNPLKSLWNANPHPARTNLSSNLNLALTTMAGTALGLALAAFYILPAAYQRRYVQIQMAILPGLRIQDNTLFHHFAQTIAQPITDPAAFSDALGHDTVLHTASLVATLLLILTVIALIATALIAKRSRLQPATNNRQPTTSLAVITATIALLLAPISLPIWTHAPELAFLQFPWRITAILAATLSLAIALALQRVTVSKALTTAIALATAITLVIPAYRAFHQPCDEEDSVPARVALFQSNRGTEPTDEYTPNTADNDALSKTGPPYWLSPDPNAPAPANSQPGPVPMQIHLTITQPGFLILNLRDYPSWDVTSADSNSLHREHPKHIHRDDGLITLPIYYPADFSIKITPKRSLDQTIGILITLVAALILLALTVYRRRNRT